MSQNWLQRGEDHWVGAVLGAIYEGFGGSQTICPKKDDFTCIVTPNLKCQCLPRAIWATFSRLRSLRLFRPTFGTQNRPLQGSKMTPTWSKNRPLRVQMCPFPSLRCFFASSFDLETNSKRSEVNLLQVSCLSGFRFSLFANMAHFMKHRKTRGSFKDFSKFTSTRALRKRSERRSENTFAKATFRGTGCQLLHHFATFWGYKKWPSKAEFSIEGRTKQQCRKITLK